MADLKIDAIEFGDDAAGDFTTFFIDSDMIEGCYYKWWADGTIMAFDGHGEDCSPDNNFSDEELKDIFQDYQDKYNRSKEKTERERCEESIQKLRTLISSLFHTFNNHDIMNRRLNEIGQEYINLINLCGKLK